uniref:Uncharacterized protein n=1 Tax=Rhizophora mucronata TaxID=61149 RepID=A0A2P2QJV3_RHIMU
MVIVQLPVLIVFVSDLMTI